MSDFRAIAAVTATLQRTLQEAVQSDVSGAVVTTVKPAEGENTNLPSTGVNLFLYQVTPNAHWRNGDLPTRRPGGDSLVQRPQAALNLHYLLSFYGSELMLEPQRLLGSAVAFLHSQPLLTRARVEAAAADPTRSFLAGSDLHEQSDLVRFTPLSLSLEDLSRVWSIFFQIKYVLSAAYQASVVLLEPDVAAAPALPTREFRLAAAPMPRSRIARVVERHDEAAPILAGGTILIEGQALRGDVTRVEIDGAEVPIDEATAEGLVVTLPADIAAGAHSVRVRHGVPIGAGNGTRLAFSSNVAAFVVVPRITKTDGDPDIEVTDVTGGTQARSAVVAVGVAPPLRPGQTATLELVRQGGVTHVFRGRERADAADAAVFDARRVPQGDYGVRVRVDGAGSPLELADDGTPVAPEVTIP